MRAPAPPAGLLLVALTIFTTGGRPHAVVQHPDARGVYDEIAAFALTGGTAEVSNLTFTRDRVEMTLTGTLYFASPVGGRVTGAVFIGAGTMRADPPPSDFERDNLRRMIDAERVESDFTSAVFRWTDDTFDLIGGARTDAGAAPDRVQRIATDAGTRFTIETGTNLPARIAASLLNGEQPGLFTAQFDGGRRGRFTCVLDHQGRIPVGSFRMNGGEKGLIYTHRPGPLYINDVWMAFYGAADYANGVVEYSDARDLVDIGHYRLQLDLRQFSRGIGLTARIDLTSRADGVRAIPFKIGESLPLAREMRREKQLRMKSARAGDQELAWVQEDWEGGFTVFLPEPMPRGQAATIEVALEGDFMDEESPNIVPECHYPIDNVTWLPRHGYLDRATFDLTFRHRKRDRIASIGTRVSEQPDPDDAEAFVTRYRMDHPVALAVFALGPFERKTQQVTWESGRPAIPLEFNSVPSRVTSINHEFILAELDNSVRYFAAMFGGYPYETFGASFHPFGFGQGFPSMLMLPPAQTATKFTHAFIAHETAHQWWGNIVAWRSYRDQWLSEGFAEYSGVLYAGKRDREGPKAAADIIRAMRESLRNPPRTALGVGSGRLNDVGPIILGLRLNTSQTLGAYQALIYRKGALVLRMLHFLMSHPSTYDDRAFVAMMKDFVERYRNRAASTEDFRAVANEHFARTPTAQKFGMRDLNWFFRQWVYGTELPSYQLEYTLAPQPDGSVVASGSVIQENAGDNWGMVLPVVFTFEGNQVARTTVLAAGARTPFELKLPMRPRKVELDPDSWILSEQTTTRAR